MWKKWSRGVAGYYNEDEEECALKYIKMQKVDITQAMAKCFYNL
jgi:hypothetical protein